MSMLLTAVPKDIRARECDFIVFPNYGISFY